MKNISILFIILLLILVSCRSDKEKTLELLTDFTKKRVRNPNSVIVHKYQIYDSIKGQFYFEKSKSDHITNKSGYIKYLFSARNQEQNEVFRTATVYVNNPKELKDRTFPENIDIENGYLTGSCKYYIGNLLTNKGFEEYCDGGNVLMLNIDTLSGHRTYRSAIQNGSFEINAIVPGNYFLKKINHDINLERVFSYYGSNKNFFLLMNIKEIMDFFDIYAREPYWYSDKSLFKSTYKELDELIKDKNRVELHDKIVEAFWRDFKKSLSRELINDFEIEEDYKYLNEYENLLIDPSRTTKLTMDIKEFFY